MMFMYRYKFLVPISTMIMAVLGKLINGRKRLHLSIYVHFRKVTRAHSE